MAYVLGLDLGTSSLKGIIMDETGKKLASSSASYPLLTPQVGFSEQNPLEWVKAADTVIKNLVAEYPILKKELKGISFSGQMHSLVLLDEENKVIRNAILWNDVRTTKQCETITEKFGPELLKITKNVPLEGFTLPKILWVQENEPQNWERVHHLMLPKDFLAFWLTGNYSTDYSDAAGTLLLDIEKRQWSQEVLTEFNISLDVLPGLYESAEKVGEMKEFLKNDYGFEKQPEVFAGGADNACGALGSGITEEGTAMASIGTSGVFLVYEKNAQVDYQGKLHVFNHTLPNQYYSMGVTLAAGNSLSWFRDTFYPNEDFGQLLSGISQVNPGSDGLLFTPYIVGERTPYRDSLIRGSFIGVDTHHRKQHFARAVLEGITFSLRDTQEIMKEFKSINKVISVGGGAKNADWLQMQADIFNVPVVTLKAEEGPGLGAAMLAAVGSGLFSSFADCVTSFVHYDKQVEPLKENVEKYESFYNVYKKVYASTFEICHELNKIF